MKPYTREERREYLRASFNNRVNLAVHLSMHEPKPVVVLMIRYPESDSYQPGNRRLTCCAHVTCYGRFDESVWWQRVVRDGMRAKVLRVYVGGVQQDKATACRIVHNQGEK